MSHKQASNERNAICDRCGFRYKFYNLKKEWTGLMVCDGCWEPRHPQDFLKVPNPEKAPEWTRPRPADVEVGPTYIDSSVGVQETTIPTGHNNGEL